MISDAVASWLSQCPGPFPCVVSSLTVHAEMEWHSSASSLSSWPLYISEDGLVVLYRWVLLVSGRSGVKLESPQSS